ncbi:MAG: DUF4831 family protein [Paludibacter sp.]|nr:DUF4831 family protein [Paludibacter sp.]
MLKIKHLIVLIAAFAICASINGQSAFVYSLPKTVLKIDITVEKTVETPGEFYQYAQRYLGVNKVITAKKTTFSIVSIAAAAQAEPNPEQTYSLNGLANKNLAISVDEKGILTGLNNFIKKEINEETPLLQNPSENQQTSDLLPLTEEYMMASSTAKMAEGAAKQIYQIREGRMSLLSGDVNNFPQGNAMGELLSRMDKEEQHLIELFTGKKTTTYQTKTIYFNPEQTFVNQVLFRLSNINGVVAADDLSGAPVSINFSAESKSQVANTNKSAVVLYYVLPVKGKITINDAQNQYFTGEFTFPQFGTVLPLSEKMLTKNTKRVLIDNQTGRLLGIE